MAHHAVPLVDLDPSHTSCIGGRTVLTCRSCAGNAPRGAICPSCSGRGFNIFTCAHCNPAAAAAAARSAVAFQTSTPDSSAPASPASLSRSSSTSVSSRNDHRQTPLSPPCKRFGNGDSSSGGRIRTNTPRGL
ncbi:hypothetical protein ATEIFO6365_0012019000 [Aspergillus terreus]|uniref:Uncharacterized protein n=1 Tax=Aspergillus terreus TaxID=33178 RepID=A0A5M3ZC38_ASPTE|nr:hypothetical protein ATETN484_0013020000 [Aspergillus terreus]GFF20434.1 hypothetical protein ATEIFO6365_0012019000 [Aspergillus terreus]